VDSTSPGKETGVVPEAGAALVPTPVVSKLSPGSGNTDHRMSPAAHRGQGGPEWPEALEIRPELVREDADTVFPLGSRSGSLMLEASTKGSMRMCTRVCLEAGEEKCSWALDPNSTSMLTIDVVGFFALLYDLIVTPYVLAMEIPVRGTLNTFAFLVAIYWTLNCILSFFVGYYRRGELNMRSWDIARHYARTLVHDRRAAHRGDAGGVDRGHLPAGGQDHPLPKGLPPRAAVHAAGQDVEPQPVARRAGLCAGDSDRVRHHGLQPLRLLRVVPHRWLDYPAGGRSSPSSESLHDMAAPYQYVAAFHWTIAQMTPGPIDIVATNSAERAFNTVVLIIGLLFGSMIISVLSGHIMQFILLRREQTRTLDTLRRFLRQSSITPSLAVRLQRQVIERMSEEVPIRIEDVPAFTMLSSALHRELQHETHMPFLLSHPAFKLCAEVDRSLAELLCEEAVSVLFMPATDELFEPGVEAEAAYCLLRGRMWYTQEPGTSHVDTTTNTEVLENTWFCEAALWTHWFHIGRMETQTACQLFQVKANVLMRVLSRKRKPSAKMLKQYGRNFHLRVVSAVPPHAPWPTDLHVPYANASDLMSQNVGLNLVRAAVDDGTLDISKEDVLHLEEELRTEKCAIQKTTDGELERIVALVALRLSRIDGRILVQVGTWSRANGFKAKVRLPERRRAIGELPRRALRRLLREDFGRYAGVVELETPKEADLCQVTHEDHGRCALRKLVRRRLHRGPASSPVWAGAAEGEPVRWRPAGGLHAEEGRGGRALRMAPAR